MSYATESIEKYLADAAADQPAPGGGSVSALAGALAASMGEMAANFTLGRKKFEDVQQEVANCRRRLTLCRRQLLILMDADVTAYSAVSAAYGMPKETGAEKAARDGAVQAALREAASVPLNTMRQCGAVTETAARLVKIANPNLLTDLAVSAILAKASCAAARINVEINLQHIKDDPFTGAVRAEMDGLTQTVARCQEEVTRTVQARLAK